MFTREFECPSCGAPIKQNKAGSRTLCCTYCGQTSHLNADSLQAVGEKQLLIDYGSKLSVGLQGKFEGRDFLLLGRVRFDYEDGFWDEWYLTFLDDGSEAWIQEDDGSFVFFVEEKKVNTRFQLHRIKVGTYNDMHGEWEPVFVTEKSRARIHGGEGELPFKIIPGEQADFFDGIWKGKVVSVELLPAEQLLFVGRLIKLKDLTLT
ncbi:MAG: DUF4178 domain-containing protein [Bacteroidetes bacterium]|nr:MAG: DUF4178 domain-containing protein [Bacteroidota bacterium]